MPQPEMTSEATNIDPNIAENATDSQEPIAPETADASAHADQDGENPDKKKDVPLNTFLNYKKKWATKLDTADSKNEEMERQNSRLQRENELLKLQTDGPSKVRKDSVPLESEFDSNEAFQSAMDNYITDKSAKTFQEMAKGQDNERTIADNQAKFDKASKAHLERGLNIDGVEDFEAAEDAARAILGDNICREIIRVYPNSEQILYSFGKNPSSAHEFKMTADTDSVQAVVNLTNIARNFAGGQSNSSLPAPDTALAGGQAASPVGWDQQVDEMLDKKVKGKITMNEYLAFRNKAKAAGWRGT